MALGEGVIEMRMAVEFSVDIVASGNDLLAYNATKALVAERRSVQETE